jgi:deoxyribodipyrimidine photo-lyase
MEYNAINPKTFRRVRVLISIKNRYAAETGRDSIRMIPDLQQISDRISNSTALFWFRRDLRIHDNAGLYHCLRENDSVQCVFIFDTAILSKLEDCDDARIAFIHESLKVVQDALSKVGSSLVILCGDPVDIFRGLKPKSVYANHDYEPYARSRDDKVAALLRTRSVPFKTFKDQVIFERNDVLKDDGKPYTVFTPYSKKWKACLKDAVLKPYPTQHYFQNLASRGNARAASPSLSDIGFKTSGILFPERRISKSIIASYHQQRDFPGIEGTTRLSVHLRFGTVSIRKLVSIARAASQVWLNELIWREFYQMILWHFPHVSHLAFKPAYDRIAWRNDPAAFEAWCRGQTGYPIVDAGMRELNNTGFMHNRVRMVTASFLIKHLLIDWRWGEAYFARKLLDYDLAANNGGWQWAAGSGCDAAPYFRILNPALQTARFDANLTYVNRWVPEHDTPAYPKPIIDHRFARSRALETYRKGLGEFFLR